MIIKVISGGQTGADQAGLRAARSNGLETGGWGPLGWETEAGPAPWLADFGLVECPEPGYPARRRRNIAEASTMILIGDLTTPGSIGTLKDWAKIRIGASYAHVIPGSSTPRSIAGFLRGVRVDGKPASTILIAGNRESLNPGIGDRAERFLVRAFRLLIEM